MSKIEKTLDRILRGTSDANINFNDLRALLKHLGFEERIRGSHHIFIRADIPEILNLQPRGSQAKPYQVKQARGILLAARAVVEDRGERPLARPQGEVPHPAQEGLPGEPQDDGTRPNQEEDGHE
jgi:HicA toxin of bacterial toxin-antitoxin,